MEIGKNIKGAVVLGWDRQISENSGLTIRITAKLSSVVTEQQTEVCKKIKQRAKICFSSRSFFTMDGRGLYNYYNSSQFPFFSVAAQSIRTICIIKAKVIVLKRQLLTALRRIPLHRRLRCSSNSADQVRRLLLLRKDRCTLPARTTKKQCC